MTATAAAVSSKRSSGRSTWRAPSNARRVRKLDWKPHRTNCSNIFRWYRSGWGRYTQADPLGKRGDPPPYAYALNNPANYVDPLGLKVRVCCREIPKLFGYKHCLFNFDNGDTIGLHEVMGSAFGKYNLGGLLSLFGATYGWAKDNEKFDQKPAEYGTETCGPWKDCADDCVKKAAKSYPTTTYSNNPLAMKNSNTFASYVSKKCSLKGPADVNDDAPGWNGSPFPTSMQPGPPILNVP